MAIIMETWTSISYHSRWGIRLSKESDPPILLEVEKVEIIQFFSNLVYASEDDHITFKYITGMSGSFLRSNTITRFNLFPDIGIKVQFPQII